MRLQTFLLAILLTWNKNPIRGVRSEDVDVIEAVPITEELNESRPQDHDTESKSSEQSDSIESAPSHAAPSYNPPPRQGGPPPRGGNHGKPFQADSYNGPPPPPPSKKQQAMDKYGTVGDTWPTPTPDMPQIISLDVKCEKNLMKVYLGFDKPFYGIVFSKGYYSNIHCIHLPAGLGRTSAHFEIGIHACGTTGNTENGLYGYGAESGSGTYFENIIVVQYDPQVQEVWDQARKLRCTWHDQYEKSVTFRPFPVDMLDVIRTDFAGDNVGCWMQIQVGKGPWAAEVSGLVKIGQTMTMVLAIKDDDSKFDMLVRNCMAHDGKRAPIQLVDQKGCVTRPKLMSRFTKIKNFGPSASVLSYANFQAFKFPDSMEVHFQCTIQICRHHCPDQCSDANANLHQLNNGILEVTQDLPAYGPPPIPPLAIEQYLQHAAGRRDERRAKRAVGVDPETEVGVNRVIRVVSTGDLTFSLEDGNATTTSAPTIVFPAKEELTNSGMICMTTPGFAVTLMILLAILVTSCLLSAFLCVKLRPFSSSVGGTLFYGTKDKKAKSCFYS